MHHSHPKQFSSINHDTDECPAQPEREPLPNKMPFDYQPFVLELFAGSARVTASLRYLGLKSSFGTDHALRNPAGKVVLCDLNTKEGRDLCRLWIKSPMLLGIFAAPPCGTCSLARTIPVRLKSGKVVPGPPPLRSKFRPNGLPGLSFTNRLRVSKTNQLYHFLAEVALSCIARGLIVAIENPKNSLFWSTSFVQPLLEHMQFTTHQACCYGGQRPKLTSLLHNHVEFETINKLCSGESPTHVHLPWGLKPDNTLCLCKNCHKQWLEAAQ